MPRIYATKDPAVTKRELDHMELSRRAASECVVLLENDGALPLHSVGRIALYGSGARLTVKGGTGSGDVNSRSSVSVEQGLENAGFTVTTKAWLRRHDEHYHCTFRPTEQWLLGYRRKPSSLLPSPITQFRARIFFIV